MNKRATAAACAVAMGWAGTGVAAVRCDAKCLESVMDRYLAQVLKHDARPLPLAPAVLSVENGQAVKLGEGSWQTVMATMDRGGGWPPSSGFPDAQP